MAGGHLEGEFAGWERLYHAYGPAVDTPAHLRALEAGERVEEAFEHLWSAILHQGTVFPATAPVVAWLCAALRDGRLAGREAAVVSFAAEAFRSADLIEVEELVQERRARLERALATYTEDEFFSDDELADDLFARGVLDLRGVGPLAADVAWHLLDRHDPALTIPLLDLVVQATKAIPDADVARLEERLTRCTQNPDEHVRTVAVFGLGELGLETTGYLADDSLAVRVAAALAPPLRADSRALAVLRDAAMQPGELDAAFEWRPPQFERYARFYVIGELCDAATEFDSLLPVALACLPLASKYTVSKDWGAFLVAAHRVHPGEMTASKRAYLAALVEREDLWDPRNGTASVVFQDAGLPYDRSGCARIAG